LTGAAGVGGSWERCAALSTPSTAQLSSPACCRAEPAVILLRLALDVRIEEGRYAYLSLLKLAAE
jgi:hypothetical protein